jgi:hypothetical protein
MEGMAWQWWSAVSEFGFTAPLFGGCYLSATLRALALLPACEDGWNLS